MQLDSEDIKAVAKSRVNRSEKKTSTTWTYGSFGALIAGMLVALYVSKWPGIIIAIIGFAGFYYYYFYVLEKKQKSAIASLTAQWRAEQGK